MSDIFRSAFNYISQAGPTILSASGVVGGGQLIAGGRVDHPLVGSVVQVGDFKLNIRSLLAEGGYALVFAVQDSKGHWYALKRQLAVDREAANAITKEIQFSRELSGHESIVQFVEAAHLNSAKNSTGRGEFLLLTELCSGGPLFNVLQEKALNPEQICKIFYSVSKAVRHMHDRNPPITHRDIKIENLLFDTNGFVKLCDFGSATTEIFRPDDNWNVLRRTQLEEDMAKYTTPMYRAPEILDTYQNYPIGPAQDVWALGCILYYLCFRKHPFEDSAKLRIINSKYTISEFDKQFEMFHNIIRSTLVPNPYSRPTIQDLCEEVERLAYNLKVDLEAPLTDLDLPSMQNPEPGNSNPLNDSKNETTQIASEMFSQLKEQGFSLFKNLKDKSASVVQTVQESRIKPTTDSEPVERILRSRPPIPPPPKFETVPVYAQQPSIKDQRNLANNNERSNVQMTARKETNFFDELFSDANNSKVPTNIEQAKEVVQVKEEFESFAPIQQERVESAELQGIRIGGTPTNDLFDSTNLLGGDEDSDKYKFDYEGANNSERDLEKLTNQVEDLLGFSTDYSKNSNPSTSATINSGKFDPFATLTEAGSASSFSNNSTDLFLRNLGENSFHRNSSAPNFSENYNKKDILDEFFATNSSTQLTNEPRPNYSRKAFEKDEPSKFKSSEKPADNVFDELLSSQGFANFTSAKNANKTLADLKRADENSTMDPVAIKIRDWTSGKDGNIRTLLCSLHEILWEDLNSKWVQPSMADVFTDAQIKKQYRKACLVVHPDKLTGTVQKELAQAIFDELLKSYKAFEANRQF